MADHTIVYVPSGPCPFGVAAPAPDVNGFDPSPLPRVRVFCETRALAEVVKAALDATTPTTEPY